jgi:hypothetical protein
MTQLFQLLFIAAVGVAIAVVALFVDKWEHTKSNQQDSSDFPEQKPEDRGQRGAAMSRLSHP